MKRNRFYTYASCFALTMMLCACPNCDNHSGEDFVKNDNEQNSSVTVKKPSVELTYNYICEEDLLQFVTPTIVYTDKDGQHEVILDEKAWSPTLHAFCYYTENGVTNYSILEPDKNGNVPEPWIIESTDVSYRKSIDVQLDEVGIENDCIVKYSKKSDYTIDPSKEYDLSRYFGCSSGKATVVSGGVTISTFSRSLNRLGEKRSWKGSEVESYIEELCKESDKVTMVIDKAGKISVKK